MAKLSLEEEQQVNLGERLLELANQPGFQDLKIKLEAAKSNSWPDPRSGKSLEEVGMIYLEGFGRAGMAQEILDWINGQVENAKYLRAKERGEIKEKKVEI